MHWTTIKTNMYTSKIVAFTVIIIIIIINSDHISPICGGFGGGMSSELIQPRVLFQGRSGRRFQSQPRWRSRWLELPQTAGRHKWILHCVLLTARSLGHWCARSKLQTARNYANYLSLTCFHTYDVYSKLSPWFLMYKEPMPVVTCGL